MNSTLFLSLVLAHIIGDFYLQTDKCCEQKETRKFKSWFLYVHAITIGLLSWMIVPSCSFGLWALMIAVSHFAIDAVKIHCPKGIGLLYIKDTKQYTPLIAGHQEFNLRGGTENVLGIIAIGESCKYINEKFNDIQTTINEINNYLEQQLTNIKNFHIV